MRKNLIIFTGQGSQKRGLGLSYLEKNRELLSEADYIFSKFGDVGKIAKEMTFMVENKGQHEIVSSAISHVMLFTLQVTIGKHFLDLYKNDENFLLGYSAGELAAAVVSGAVSIESGIDILKARILTLDSLPKGKMLSLLLPIELASPPEMPGIEVAAINSPRHFVVSGESMLIDKYNRLMIDNNIITIPVKSDYPFHHTMMQPAVDLFNSHTPLNIKGYDQVCDFISAFDGQKKNTSQLKNYNYWSDHSVRKLNIVKAFENLRENNNIPNSIIELGASGSLATFAVNFFSIHPTQVTSI